MQALPIDTKLDTAAETVNVTALDPSVMQAATPVGHSETLPKQAETEAEDGQLLWPMMPSETLTQLAKTFYPDSPILEQRFIQKTIRLTKTLGVTLLPDTPFRRVQVIAIPDEKEVRAVTHRIKRLQDITHAQNQLTLSYQLKLSNQLKSVIPPPPKPNKTTAAPQTHAVPVLPKPASKPVLSNAPVTTTASWARMWQQAQSTVSAWGETSKAYLAAAFSSLHLSVARLTQNNPQWRNGLYLVLLLLTGYGLWSLQKRYMRRQIALLNSITTTLENAPADTEEANKEVESVATVTNIAAYHVQDEDRTAAA